MVDIDPSLVTTDQMVGIGLTISGTIFSSLGANIQAYFQHLQIFFEPDEKSEYDRMQKVRPYYCHISWISGFLLIILGAIIEIAALGYTSQSIVVPIWCIGFIVNFLFALWFLGEPCSKPNVIGMLLIFFGTIILTIFGSEKKPVRSTDDFQRLFARNSFIGYITFALCFCLIIVVYLRYSKSTKQKNKRALLSNEQGTLQGTDGDVTHPRTLINPKSGRTYLGQQEDHERSEKPFESKSKSELFCYFTLAGLFGGHSIMFLKIAVELTVATALTDFHELERWLFWLAIFIAVLLIFFQLAILLRSIQELDSLYLIPVYQMVFLLSAIMSGIMYFEELFKLSGLKKFAYILGAGTTLVGAYLVSRQNLKSEKAGKLVFTGTLSLSKIIDDLLLKITFKLNEFWMHTQEEKDYENDRHHIAHSHDDGLIPGPNQFPPSNGSINPLGKDDVSEISSSSKFFGNDVASETSSMTDEVPSAVYSFDNTNEQRAKASFLKWTSAAGKHSEPETERFFDKENDFVAQHESMQHTQESTQQQRQQQYNAENDQQRNEFEDEDEDWPQASVQVHVEEKTHENIATQDNDTTYGGLIGDTEIGDTANTGDITNIGDVQEEISENIPAHSHSDNNAQHDEEIERGVEESNVQYSFSQVDYSQQHEETSDNEVTRRDMSNWESD